MKLPFSSLRFVLLLVAFSVFAPTPSGIVGCGPGDVPKSEEPQSEPMREERPGADKSQDAALPEGEPAGESGPTETIPPENAPPPRFTWAQCRRKKDTLTTRERAYCDQHYKTPAKAYKYSIRWIFLYDRSNERFWAKRRIDMLNEQFKRANMSFQTHSTIELVNTPAAVDGVLDRPKKLTFGQIKGSLAKLLGVPKDWEDKAVLDAWKERLSQAGVSPDRVNGLTLARSYEALDFFWIISRMFEEEICIFVAKRLEADVRRNTAGFANLPDTKLNKLERPSIFLRDDSRIDTSAHEMGHFFGLRHTQAEQDTVEFRTKINPECAQFALRSLESLKSSLQRLLGSDYTKSFTNAYPPYDGTTLALRDFAELRCALGVMWVRRVKSFLKPDKDDPTTWKNFADFPSFAEHVFGEKPAYEKFFSRVVNGRTSYNCRLKSVPKIIECFYGKHVLDGKHPLLFGSLSFGDGRVSNLMSYLNGATDFPKRELAPAQIEILQLNAKATERLALRNHAPTK